MMVLRTRTLVAADRGVQPRDLAGSGHSGLGLYAAKTVVGTRGGRVEVRNRLEGGAEVAFTISVRLWDFYPTLDDCRVFSTVLGGALWKTLRF